MNEIKKNAAKKIHAALSTLLKQVGEEVKKMKREIDEKADFTKDINAKCWLRDTSYNYAIDDVRSRLDSVISSYKKE